MAVRLAAVERQLPLPVRVILSARRLQIEVHHARHGIIRADRPLQVATLAL